MHWTGYFEQHEAMYKECVLQDTWGHLAPKMGEVYTGIIIFTLTEWNQSELISCKFKDLSCSPWFFDHMKEYIFQYCKNNDNVGVYKFVEHIVCLKMVIIDLPEKFISTT